MSLVPVPDQYSQPFWDGLKRQQIILPECQQCSAVNYPPQKHCVQCLHDQHQWRAISLVGKLYSYTVQYVVVHPAFVSQLPLICAIVDLGDGVRVATRIINAKEEQLVIAMSLQAVFHQVDDDHTLLYFEPTR